jgi:hypothetical protein
MRVAVNRPAAAAIRPYLFPSRMLGLGPVGHRQEDGLTPRAVDVRRVGSIFSLRMSTGVMILP